MSERLHPLTRRSAAWALALGLAALGLRLFRLAAQSLWLDEGGTWSEVQRPWGELLADLLSPRAGYPLYHLLMKLWVGVAGDSEWALRMPSALAGALAVALLVLLGTRLAGLATGVGAGAALLLNPFALFQAQDAKVYALLTALLLAAALALLWLLERPQELRRWLVWAASIAVLLSAHRFALLALVGMAALVAWSLPGRRAWWRWTIPVALAAAFFIGLRLSLTQDPNAPPVGASATPWAALWVVTGRLSLDRAPGDVLLWLLPALAPALIGVWAAFGERRGEPALWRFLVCIGALPLGLYAAALGMGWPLFEPRYVAFFGLPALALATGRGLAWLLGAWRRSAGAAAAGAGLGLLAAAQLWALLSAPYGLWSGNAVKEDYRGAIRRLAEHVAPGDAVVIHPPYVMPLYRYYAPRVAPHALPEPLAFGRIGALDYSQKEFDNDYSTLLAGHKRAWLLIAPLNARTVDPPDPRYPQDDMGKVGINFLTAEMNDKWRCIDEPYWAFNGVRLLCQSFPRGLEAGSLELRQVWPIPTSVTGTWGGLIALEGFALLPWAEGPWQAGGTLPLALHWRALAPLERDYRMFVHLVPAPGAPVAAQRDTAPLYGGLPTSRWPVDLAIHDEVAVVLPADMPAGRYTVMLGWYDPAIADPESQRLPLVAASGQALENALVLGEVEIRASGQAGAE